jgi:hypothetical protein
MYIPHRQQHQIGPDLEFAARDVDELAILPFDATCDESLELAVLALERISLLSPIAL